MIQFIYFVFLIFSLFFFFFKQKTAYELRISDWSSDVCSSDLKYRLGLLDGRLFARLVRIAIGIVEQAEAVFHLEDRLHRGVDEIGRASCRERVCQYV